MSVRTGRLGMKAWLLTVVAIFMVAGPAAWAEPVDADTAQGVAARYMQLRHGELRISPSRERIQATNGMLPGKGAGPDADQTTPLLDPETGQTIGYVTALDPVGYVVTSADTKLNPVVAISFSSNFSFEEVPQNILLYMVRADLKQRLTPMVAKPDADAADTEAKWEDLTTDGDAAAGDGDGEDGGEEPDGYGSAIWGPHLDTQWGQGESQWGWYYNQYCPVDPITGQLCATGCAATASSQIANYWMWPHSIDFIGGDPNDSNAIDSYESKRTPPPPNDQERVIPIDADDADVPLMLYTGNPDDPNHPTGDMTGRLMFALGVATKMKYSSAGSGGNCGLGHPRIGYSSPGGDLTSNMKAGRPAYCRVDNIVLDPPEGEAHAIVCDGVWESDNPAIDPVMYHLNFGWKGNTDGWYINTEEGMPPPWGTLSPSYYSPPAPQIELSSPNDTAYEGTPYVQASPPVIGLATRSRPVTWSLTGTVPDGLAIDPDTGALIWDEPNIQGSPYTLTLEAENEAGQSAPVTFDLFVEPAAPDIEEIPDQIVEAGVAYSYDPNLLAGSLPITWSLEAGPGGVNGTTGQYTWDNPTIGGSPYTVTIEAVYTPDSNLSDTETWQLTVMTAPTMDPIADATLCAGDPYTFTPTVPAGSTPITWTLVTGPAGMELDPNNGELTWPDPTVAGSPHEVTLRAENAVGSDEKTWYLTVEVRPVINPVPDRFIATGSDYVETLTLVEPSDTVEWDLDEGPPGMTLDDPNEGVLRWDDADDSGSPYTVTMSVSNDCNHHQISWQLTVAPEPEIAAIADQEIDTYGAYSLSPSLVTPTLPGTWSLVTGPSGMTVDPATGEVSWPTPTTTGSPFSVQIRFSNPVGEDTESWQLTVTLPAGQPVIEAIGNGTVVEDHQYTGPTPVLSHGDPPMTWSLDAAPAGMTIDPATGVVEWDSPTVTGSPHTITIRAAYDPDPNLFDTESWQLTVTPKIVAPVITAINDAEIDEGDAYTGPTPTLDQGTTPVTWSLTAGPTGMTINATSGVVEWPSPTPTGSPHTVTIQAECQADPNLVDDESWTLTVTPAPVAPEIGDLGVIPEATVGVPYLGPIPTVTGTPPIEWFILAGPTGMTIDTATGQVSWPNPTVNGGPRHVEIEARSDHGTDQAEFDVIVNAVPTAPQISPIDDDATESGQPYTGPTPTATGTAPIAWSLESGPAGMTMPDPNTGVVTWPNPTSAGSPFSVTIKATNDAGDDEATFTLTVTEPAVTPAIAAIGDDTITEGQAYTGPTPTLLSGEDVTWSLVTGPASMMIDGATGVVTWPSPTATGSPHTITIRATNAAGSDDETWTLTVDKPIVPPVINPISDADATAGQTYTGPIPTLSQGDAPVEWSLVDGPGGMTIDEDTGVVSWPFATAVGQTHAVQIRAANNGGDDTEAWNVAVVPVKAAVTIGVSPSDKGMAVNVDGQTYTSAHQFNWEVGSSHVLSVAETQTGSDGADYVFDSWSDGEPSATRTLVVSAPGMLTATMEKVVATGLAIIGPTTVQEETSEQYELELTLSDGSKQDVTASGTWRLSSTACATMADGKVTAAEVDGDCNCEIHATHVNNGKSLTARLPITIANEIKQYTLTVSTSPAGSGSPARSTHDEGKVVSVAAPDPPEAGLEFVGWAGDVIGSDATCYVTMSGNRNVVALFAKPGEVPTEVSAGFCGAAPTLMVALVFVVCLIGHRPSRRRRR